MTSHRDAYLLAAESAAALLAEPAVAAGWAGPSALEGFTVGGLAGHLAHQVFSVPRILGEPPATTEPVTLAEHFAGARWVGADVDSEISVGIRRSGETTAAEGAAALAQRVQEGVAQVREAIAAQPADRLVVTPTGPWALRLDDFLLTRVMELAVHSDDLAYSVDMPTPELPASVLDPVLELLTQLAVRRHGPTAVLRALSRAERAPTTIAAF